MSMTRKDFQTIAEHIHNALDNNTDIMEGLLRSFEAINPAFSREKFIKEAIPEKLLNKKLPGDPFEIGDRVEGIGVVSGLSLRGEFGTVVKFDPGTAHSIGVEWERSFGPLHDLSGGCPDGFGWWCSEEALQHA